MAFHACKLFYTIPPHTNAYIFLLMVLVWWFLMTITLSSPPVSCTPTSTKKGVLCQEIERQALLTVKAGLRDKASLLSSWSDDNQNCCHWKGVSCRNQTGHVMKLDLRNPFQDLYGAGEKYFGFMLEGKISSSLLKLKYLEYLDLSLNDFDYSMIPPFLGSFEKLRYLNLSFSYFTGIVPPHFGNLSSLEYLDLGGNNGLEVESLRWLKGLPSLKHLNLDFVDLMKAGNEWFKAFNMLPLLSELHLRYCELSNLPLLVNPSINFTSLSTLDLSYNNFNSTLTMPPWLFNLTSLVNLHLSDSSLGSVGGILDEIGKLVELEQLDFSTNHISGQLPASLGNLSRLVILNLGSNRGIEGSIPTTFGNLCKLRALDMRNNKLDGEINEFIDGLARCYNGSRNNHLEILSLSGNKLLGTLPSSLGSLVKLDSLDLSGNSFWGSIPTTIGSLTSLRDLDLSDNQMNGTIARSMGQLSELEILRLSGNHWQGLLIESHFEKHTKLQSLSLSITTSKGNLVMNVTQDWLPPFRSSLTSVFLDGIKMWSKNFPRWTLTLHELETLSLEDCDLSDSIPTEFWKSCPNLTLLYLSNNAIPIHMSFENLERLLPRVPAGKLKLLALANISFSNNGGHEIPSNIAQLAPSLYLLDLSSNHISGEIPLSICQLKHLSSLLLRKNLLTGELTRHQWETMESLEVLDVSNNRLVGKIPESLGSLTDLNVLLFSNNNLHGELPTFQNCSSLQVLDFGGNKLTGNVPSSLAENNTMLVLLKLRGNMLSGTIPPAFCLLSALQTLDLAHNLLQGIIPKCLGNLSKSNEGNNGYLSDGIALVSKGREYIYSRKILSLVHLVDLSGNNLSGNIPESLMNLTAMQTLNLSMNHLTGKIPSNIGLLKKLESLDLSLNHLSGPIPLSIADMSSLSYLNLSHNNLSGRIPSSRQLQTLEESSSYDGNPFLCGLPLPTKCLEDGTPDDHEEEAEEKVEHGKKIFDLEEWGFILSLVLGFVVGFLGICGSLVLKSSWREAYFGYLAGMKDNIIVTVVVNAARLRRKMGISE